MSSTNDIRPYVRDQRLTDGFSPPPMPNGTSDCPAEPQSRQQHNDSGGYFIKKIYDGGKQIAPSDCIDPPKMREILGCDKEQLSRYVDERILPRPMAFDGRWIWLPRHADAAKKALEAQAGPETLPAPNVEEY